VTDEDADTHDSATLPKLTLGQRMLTALPNLQRAPKPAPGAGDAHEAEPEDGARDAVAAPPARGTRAPQPRRAPAGRASVSPKNDPTAGMSQEEIVKAIKTLDDRERFLAMFAGPLGAAVGIALAIIGLHLNPAPGHKNHAADSLFLWYGGARVLLGAVVVAAAVTRRRSFVGFALLFLGTSMGNPLFALPFWALGGWLIWRVFKMQRALAARGGSTRRGRAAPAADARSTAPATSRSQPATGSRPPRPRAGAAGGAAAARERAKQRRRRKDPEPAGPPPSKRYTPPKPTRPRPPAPSA